MNIPATRSIWESKTGRKYIVLGNCEVPELKSNDKSGTVLLISELYTSDVKGVSIEKFHTSFTKSTPP